MLVNYIIFLLCILIIIFVSFGIYVLVKTKTIWQANESKKLNTYLVIILLLFIAHLGLAVMLFAKGIIIFGKLNTPTTIFNEGQFIFSSLEVSYTVMLSLERFLHVRYPFHYRRHENVYMFVFLLTPVILCVISLALSPRFLISFVFILLGGLIVLVSNIYLYYTIRKQSFKIKSTMVHRNTKQQIEGESVMRRKQMRSLKICAFMTLTYCLLWFPFSLLHASPTANETVILLRRIFYLFAYLNALTDVFIYLTLCRNARRVLRLLFKRADRHDND